MSTNVVDGIALAEAVFFGVLPVIADIRPPKKQVPKQSSAKQPKTRASTFPVDMPRSAVALRTPDIAPFGAWP